MDKSLPKPQVGWSIKKIIKILGSIFLLLIIFLITIFWGKMDEILSFGVAMSIVFMVISIIILTFDINRIIIYRKIIPDEKITQKSNNRVNRKQFAVIFVGFRIMIITLFLIMILIELFSYGHF